MTIAQLRALALYHAEQAANNTAAAAGLGVCGAAQEFREKADWHRETAEQLSALANQFAELVRQYTGQDGPDGVNR